MADKEATGLQRAKDAAGGSSGLGRLLGVSAQAVSQWQQVPANRVVAIEKATGVTRHELRPDIFGASGVAGLNESVAPAYVLPPAERGERAPAGHFSRYFSLQRKHFSSGEEVVAHVQALRDEWDRR